MSCSTQHVHVAVIVEATCSLCCSAGCHDCLMPQARDPPSQGGCQHRRTRHATTLSVTFSQQRAYQLHCATRARGGHRCTLRRHATAVALLRAPARLLSRMSVIESYVGRFGIVPNVVSALPAAAVALDACPESHANVLSNKGAMSPQRSPQQ